MNRSLFIAMALMLGSAGQVFAADAAGSSVCPTRAPEEAFKAFRDRTHDYCEVKWTGLVASNATGGQTHDHYINVCSRDCYGDLGAQAAGQSMAANGGLVVGLAAGAGVVAATSRAAGAGLGGNGPASP